jgi:hypothetical protein
MSSPPQCGLTRLDNRMVSEIFHALSQPLTTLHCSLELAARKEVKPRNRKSIEQALSEVQQISALASHLRNLIETTIG